MRCVAVLVGAVLVCACGRAGPGATLTRRKDPDVEAHTVEHKECRKLELRKKLTRKGKMVEDRVCTQWVVTDTEQVDAVRHPAYERGDGPAPAVSILPVLAIGHGVSDSGVTGDGAWWLAAEGQLHWIPRFDRLSLYVSAGYLGVLNQGDLSGVAGGGGVMLAPTAWLSVDAHAGVIARDAGPWRAGGGLRFRPWHRTSRDLVISLSLDYLAGEDEIDDRGELVPNHSTGLMVGFTGGWLR